MNVITGCTYISKLINLYPTQSINYVAVIDRPSGTPLSTIVNDCLKEQPSTRYIIVYYSLQTLCYQAKPPLAATSYDTVGIFCQEDS
jgi:hypothetical protein